MRVFGYDLSLRKARTDAPTVSVAVGQPATAHFGGVLGYGSQIKDQTPYDDIDKIVKAIPYVDVGLRKYCRLCGGFRVRSEDQRAQDQINRWLGHPDENGAPKADEVVSVDWVQRGAESFLMRHLRSMFQYGKGLGEIALDGSGRDVWQLLNVPSRSVCLRFEGGNLEYGQKNSLGFVRWFDRQDLFLYNVNDPEGDDPHGTSMLRSAPWLANIALSIENAVRQLWQRLGAPPQVIDLKLPESTIGMSDDRVAAIESLIRSAWKKAALDRFQGDGIRDFTSAHHGDLSVKTVGSDVHELNLQESLRAIMEQVAATTELPPFMLGIQWATTERLSDNQADAIAESVEATRYEVQPDLLHMCEVYAELKGLQADSLSPDWSDVSLKNRKDQAQADYMEAQAESVRHRTAVDQWRQGFINQAQAAEASIGDEWNGDLATELEAPVSPPPAGGAAALSYNGNGNGKAQRQASFANYL